MKPELLKQHQKSRVEFIAQFNLKPNDIILCYRTEDDEGEIVPASVFTFLEYKSELIPMKILRRLGDKVFFIATRAEQRAKSKFSKKKKAN